KEGSRKRIILPEIASLKKLRIWVRLKELDLSPLRVSQNLELLYITHGGKDTDLSPLASNKKLRHLTLWGCDMSDIDFSSLSNLPLEYLDLRSNQIHSLDLPKLPQLRELYLGGNKFQKIDLSCISKFKSLQRLNLIKCGIVEIDLSPLSGLSNLVNLDLENNRLEKLDLTPLKKIEKLVVILRRNRTLREVDVTPILWSYETTVVPGRGTKLIASKEKFPDLESYHYRKKEFIRRIKWY
ncbi:MAG: leucine-rich repeat domain-containing protein, partial [Candidatus Thorarchaeota archaeon]